MKKITITIIALALMLAIMPLQAFASNAPIRYEDVLKNEGYSIGYGYDRVNDYKNDENYIVFDAEEIEGLAYETILGFQNVRGFRQGDREDNCIYFAQVVAFGSHRIAFFTANPSLYIPIEGEQVTIIDRYGTVHSPEGELLIFVDRHTDISRVKAGDTMAVTNRTGGSHAVVVLEVDWANDKLITAEGNVNGRVEWFMERNISDVERGQYMSIETIIAYAVRNPSAPATPAQPTQPSNPAPQAPATPSNPGLVNNTGEIMVLVDGVQVIFDQQPVIQNGRTLVGFRAIAEAMDTEVTWDQATKGIEAIRNGVTVNMTIGSDIMLVNGRQVTLDVPAQILNGRTMLPLRALIEAFDCKVEWDGAQKIVTITTNDTNAPAVSTPATQAPSNPTPTAPAQTAPATNEYVITNNSTGKTLDITITNGSSHSYVKGTAGGSRTGSLNELTYTTMSTNIVVKLNGKTTTVRPGNTVTIQP